MGGLLSRAGHEVWLINHRQAQVNAMQSAGLIMRINGQDSAVPVKAALHCRDIPVNSGPFDLIVVLVKSFDTAAAIGQVLPLLGPDTMVLSLQNGMGHEDLIAPVVGAHRLLAGRTYVGGQLIAPGHVVVGAAGKDTIIGEFDGQLTPRAVSIARIFTEAGLKTQASDNIRGVIWDKLLVNVATGALSAITGLHYGELYPRADIEEYAVAAADEAMRVARAAGVQLSFINPRDAWIKAGAGLPHDFKASMLQSIERGSRTEIDFINGAVVREGAKFGLATPVNGLLVACVHGMERRLELASLSQLRPAS